ncbi:MAG: leucine-rich repeat domain-containing protein, partial [Clostridia bacterium]
MKTIAGGAFSSSAVLSVKTPENLRNIEGGAFAGCKSLKTVDLSASTRLSGVDHQTFRDCTALSEILFPDSIELIGSRAFFNCTALTSVTLPADLTSIYGQAFGNCTGMTAVTIPKGIVFIHIWAFDNHASELVISGYSGSCAETFATDNHIPFKALGTVVIPPLVLGETSHVAVTERKTFSFTPSTTGSYTLSVGSGAYSPTLSLYDGAWKLLSSGSKLSFKLIAGNPYYYACTLPTYDQASPDTYPITLRKAPGTEDGYEYEIAYNKATIIGYTGTATALVIPEAITDGGTVYQVTRIESYAFENGTFTSVTLPAQLSVINGGAFEGCKELRDIVIPDRLQRIYGFAFSGCTQLAKVEMSQWTMLIGDWAFQGCQNLTIHAPTDSYAHSYATRNGIRFASSGAMDVTPLVPDQDYDITFNKATARKLFSFTPTETG